MSDEQETTVDMIREVILPKTPVKVVLAGQEVISCGEILTVKMRASYINYEVEHMGSGGNRQIDVFEAHQIVPIDDESITKTIGFKQLK